VVVGYDGKPRCVWAGAGDTAFGRYHDEVWGTRTYDESAMFEALTLGVFEVGLSFSIVFGKRDAFRRAFHGFDIAKASGDPWIPGGDDRARSSPGSREDKRY
jgi:DNA-3-methyladenine glycosylase I